MATVILSNGQEIPTNQSLNYLHSGNPLASAPVGYSSTFGGVFVPENKDRISDIKCGVQMMQILQSPRCNR